MTARAYYSRLKRVLPYCMVLGFALLLLLYVGSRGAKRTFTRFQIGKAEAYGAILQAPVNSFLASGLPLDQYAGFRTRALPMLRAENYFSRIDIVAGKRVLHRAGSKTAVPLTAALGFGKKKKQQVLQGDCAVVLQMDLSTRFERVGGLRIWLREDLISSRVNGAFLPVWLTALFLVVLALLLGGRLHAMEAAGFRKIVRIGFGAALGITIVVMMFSLLGLYREGIRGRSLSMAKSISSRLGTIREMGLKLEDISGVRGMFSEYRRVDRDIGFISLVSNKKVLIHTDKSREGSAVVSESRFLEFSHKLPGFGSVRLGIRSGVIISRLWRSGRAFVILAIAAAFIAYLFFNLILAHQKRQEEQEDAGEGLREYRLELLRPLYFLTIFVEGLLTAFLPQYFQEISLASGFPAGASSWLFTVYFIAFVISLLPAGRYADKRGLKKLLLAGIVLYIGSYLLLAVSGNFYLVTLSRTMAGLGQGMLFIAVQGYILGLSGEHNKTQANSIIPIGYNGGLIAGTAIGGLLVGFAGYRGVFLICGVTGAALLLYSFRLLPDLLRKKVGEYEGSFWSELGSVFRDRDFNLTMAFVGIPTKAVLTGVYIFAIPLLLSGMGFPKEDIGQILIFYSVSVLISTRIVARIADRLGKTRRILFFGTQLSGVGLFLISLMGAGTLQTVALLGGLTVLGFAHGFIHAPIVTHIARTESSGKLGVNSVTSLYRFLERIGHVLGPVLVGGLLYGMRMKPSGILIVTLVVVALGLFFLLFGKRRKEAEGGDA